MTTIYRWVFFPRYQAAWLIFRVGLWLINRSLKVSKTLDREMSRMLKLYDVTGDIEGFEANLNPSA